MNLTEKSEINNPQVTALAEKLGRTIFCLPLVFSVKDSLLVLPVFPLLLKIKRSTFYYNCYNYSYITPCELFKPALGDDISFSMSFSNSPQVSRTLLSILSDLSNPVVWMVAARLLISNSSSSLTKPLGTVTNSPMITVTFVFHSFFLVL